MKDAAKKEIARNIQTIASRLLDIPSGVKMDSSVGVHFWDFPTHPKYLDKESESLYYGILRSFRKDEPFSTKISIRLLARLFKSLLAEYLSRPHTLDETVHLIEKLESEATAKVRTWYYYMTVEGVILKTPDIHFGKHRLFQMDQTRLALLLSQNFEIIDQMHVSDEVRQIYRVRAQSDFDHAHDLKDKACIQLEIEGDEDRLGEMAGAEASPIIQILTFFGHGCLWSTQKCRIGFSSLYTIQRCHFLRMSTDLTIAGFSIEWPSNIEIFTIDEPALKNMKVLGMQSLIDIYDRRKSGTSEVEKMLLRAIQYFYQGYTALEEISEYLSYIMIFETFLTTGDRVELTNTIAEGVAILIEKDCEKRIKLKRYVKSLYGSRSSLIHGKTDKIDIISVRDAQYFAYKLIQLVLENRGSWKKQTDILGHIDKIKFS